MEKCKGGKRKKEDTGELQRTGKTLILRLSRAERSSEEERNQQRGSLARGQGRRGKKTKRRTPQDDGILGFPNHII